MSDCYTLKNHILIPENSVMVRGSNKCNVIEHLDLCLYKFFIRWCCPILVVVGKKCFQFWLKLFHGSLSGNVVFGFCDKYFDASIRNFGFIQFHGS